MSEDKYPESGFGKYPNLTRDRLHRLHIKEGRNLKDIRENIFGCSEKAIRIRIDAWGFKTKNDYISEITEEELRKRFWE